MKHTKQSIISKDGISYLIPFILITSCFALWGFANDITNPMVKAFSKIFRMSATDGALVQVAFYGGYFAMAFPAAIFIRKYSYKAGVLLGLGMYAFGAFLFFPAKMTGEYYPFLIAYFILTCGLSFLETSCNCPIFLCRCTNYVLDFHHSVWNTLVHVTRYGREKCGSTISTI